MKSHTRYLTFNTATKREYINITGEVEEALRESGIREGMILVSAMHITAAVYVNDAEPGLIQDIDDWLDYLLGPLVDDIDVRVIAVGRHAETWYGIMGGENSIPVNPSRNTLCACTLM